MAFDNGGFLLGVEETEVRKSGDYTITLLFVGEVALFFDCRDY